eukprot:2174771-Prymnesium_polylepis.1
MEVDGPPSVGADSGDALGSAEHPPAGAAVCGIECPEPDPSDMQDHVTPGSPDEWSLDSVDEAAEREL